jgi:hypothetical protein
MPPENFVVVSPFRVKITGTDSYRDLIGATLAFRHHNKLVAERGVEPAILDVMSVMCAVHHPAIKILLSLKEPVKFFFKMVEAAGVEW